MKKLIFILLMMPLVVKAQSDTLVVDNIKEDSLLIKSGMMKAVVIQDGVPFCESHAYFFGEVSVFITAYFINGEYYEKGTMIKIPKHQIIKIL